MEKEPIPFTKKPSSQYDVIGKDYLVGATEFLEKGLDEGRRFIDGHLGDLEGKVLLDIGCGPGLDIERFEKKGAIVFRVDRSAEMLSEARKKISDPLRLSIGSYTNTGLPPQEFDFIVGRHSLHYVGPENIDKAYEEMARIMKPGGILLLVVTHPEADSREKRVAGENGEELVQTSLFKGKVIIKYPFHTKEEYFSPRFNELFELVGEPLEYRGPERDSDASVNTLAFCAKKRTISSVG